MANSKRARAEHCPLQRFEKFLTCVLGLLKEKGFLFFIVEETCLRTKL